MIFGSWHRTTCSQNWLKGKSRTLGTEQNWLKIMDIQIADGADSLPGRAQISTFERQGWNSPLTYNSPLLPAVLSFSCTPLPSCPLRGSGSRRTSHSLGTAREGVSTLLASPNPALKGQQRSTRQPLSHHSTHCLLLWELTISPHFVWFHRPACFKVNYSSISNSWDSSLLVFFSHLSI